MIFLGVKVNFSLSYSQIYLNVEKHQNVRQF